MRHDVDAIECSQIRGSLSVQTSMTVVLGLDLIDRRSSVEHGNVDDGPSDAELDAHAGSARAMPAKDDAVGNGRLVHVLAAEFLSQFRKRCIEQVRYGGGALGWPHTEPHELLRDMLRRSPPCDVIKHGSGEDASN